MNQPFDEYPSHCDDTLPLNCLMPLSKPCGISQRNNKRPRSVIMPSSSRQTHGSRMTRGEARKERLRKSFTRFYVNGISQSEFRWGPLKLFCILFRSRIVLLAALFSMTNKTSSKQKAVLKQAQSSVNYLSRYAQAFSAAQQNAQAQDHARYTGLSVVRYNALLTI